MYREPEQIELTDNGIFPNSPFPVLHYRKVLDLPFFFAAAFAERLFHDHGWSNSWRDSVYAFQHYHSNTHEVMAVCQGGTDLLLGGDNGRVVSIGRGDVLVLPAGVAHKNLRPRRYLRCVGAYPEGKAYDMQFGAPGERPDVDARIAAVPMPLRDPVSCSMQEGLPVLWRNVARQLEQRFPGAMP
jgi:uncharacterized protein YjlB